MATSLPGFLLMNSLQPDLKILSKKSSKLFSTTPYQSPKFQCATKLQWEKLFWLETWEVNVFGALISMGNQD
jgi:hypothetical protein